MNKFNLIYHHFECFFIKAGPFNYVIEGTLKNYCCHCSFMIIYVVIINTSVVWGAGAGKVGETCLQTCGSIQAGQACTRVGAALSHLVCPLHHPVPPLFQLHHFSPYLQSSNAAWQSHVCPDILCHPVNF